MASRFLLLLLLAFPAAAADVAGVSMEDRAKVADTELLLNGGGLRQRVFFRVYAMGLYLPKKIGSAPEAINAQGPKRVLIHMLRDVEAGQFTDALSEGIRANHSEAEAKALEPRVRELGAIMAEVKEAKKGMRIALDWTGAGTQVLIQGKPAGAPIAGEDFYRALLRIWLGDRPVQDDLKKALLGA
jgi:Chalcone isomerase-like